LYRKTAHPTEPQYHGCVLYSSFLCILMLLEWVVASL